MSIDEIRAEFAKVLQTPTYPRWAECLSYAVIAAAFTLFFSGFCWVDAAVSFAVGTLLKWVVFFSDKTLKNKIFARFFAMCLACAVAHGGVELGWLTTIDNVMIGNIMTLIPGVGLTNALRDLFTGDSIAGLLRLIEAVLTALAIAAGYFLYACTLGTLSTASAGSESPVEVLQIVTGFLGALGFAILYNIRGKKLFFAALGGFFSWALFVLLGFAMPNEALRYFIVAVTVSIYAEVMARLLKTPTTTFLITALIPLIPGGSLYYTMTSAFKGDVELFTSKGMYTLQLSVALALGIVLTSALTKILLHALSLRHAKRAAANNKN